MMTTPHFKAKAKRLALSATLAIGLMSVQVQSLQASGVPVADGVVIGMIGKENVEQITRWVTTIKQYAGEAAFWQAQYKALESGNYGAIAVTLGARFLGPAMQELKTSIMQTVDPDGYFTKGGSCKKPTDGANEENYNLCQAMRKEVAAYSELLKQVETQIANNSAQIQTVYAKANNPDISPTELNRLNLEMSTLNANISSDRTTLMMLKENHQQTMALLQQKQKEVVDAALTGDYAGFGAGKMNSIFPTASK